MIISTVMYITSFSDFKRRAPFSFYRRLPLSGGENGSREGAVGTGASPVRLPDCAAAPLLPKFLHISGEAPCDARGQAAGDVGCFFYERVYLNYYTPYSALCQAVDKRETGSRQKIRLEFLPNPLNPGKICAIISIFTDIIFDLSRFSPRLMPGTEKHGTLYHTRAAAVAVV